MDVGDISGDGYPDVIQGGWKTNYVLINTGNDPSLWTRQPLRPPLTNNYQNCTTDLLLDDIVGDSRLDVIVVNGNSWRWNCENYILENDGTAPQNWPKTVLSKAGYYDSASVDIGDLNRDGQEDIVIGNGRSYYSQYIENVDVVYLNMSVNLSCSALDADNDRASDGSWLVDQRVGKLRVNDDDVDMPSTSDDIVIMTNNAVVPRVLILSQGRCITKLPTDHCAMTVSISVLIHGMIPLSVAMEKLQEHRWMFQSRE